MKTVTQLEILFIIYCFIVIFNYSTYASPQGPEHSPTESLEQKIIKKLRKILISHFSKKPYAETISTLGTSVTCLTEASNSEAAVACLKELALSPPQIKHLLYHTQKLHAFFEPDYPHYSRLLPAPESQECGTKVIEAFVVQFQNGDFNAIDCESIEADKTFRHLLRCLQAPNACYSLYYEHKSIFSWIVDMTESNFELHPWLLACGKLTDLDALATDIDPSLTNNEYMEHKLGKRKTAFINAYLLGHRISEGIEKLIWPAVAIVILAEITWPIWHCVIFYYGPALMRICVQTIQYPLL